MHAGDGLGPYLCALPPIISHGGRDVRRRIMAGVMAKGNDYRL